MARKGILALCFFVLVASDVSNASILWRVRKLIDTDPKDKTNGTQSVSPSPGPVSVNGKSDPPAPNNSYSKNPEPKDKNCDGVPHSCEELKLRLCIRSDSNDASGNLTAIVQNEGDSIFKGNLTAGSVSKEMDIAEHKSSMINITSSVKISNISIKSANGECVYTADPLVSDGNIFVHIPTFDQLATPINAAYFLILTVLIFGGTWACCKCRKKRQHGGIPYHELEMAQPDSLSATSAQGWDQDWGEDWDEESAVKSPGGLRVGSISANGLTARSTNKDGWENDWND